MFPSFKWGKRKCDGNGQADGGGSHQQSPTWANHSNWPHEQNGPDCNALLAALQATTWPRNHFLKIIKIKITAAVELWFCFHIITCCWWPSTSSSILHVSLGLWWLIRVTKLPWHCLSLLCADWLAHKNHLPFGSTFSVVHLLSAWCKLQSGLHSSSLWNITTKKGGIRSSQPLPIQ